LHLHTWYSDGRASPADVLAHAHALGLTTIALTDHDNARGAREAAPLAERLGIDLIPAIEFTCRWDVASDAGWHDEMLGAGDIDVLGYCLDLDAPALQTAEQAMLEDIHDRVTRCCARLTAVGYPTAITGDAAWLTGDHMAALVALGLDGLEVYHPRLGEEARRHFLALAEQFDLVVTGGSDEHGWPDGFIEMGTQPVTLAMVQALRARSNWKVQML
jgi:hypothetical protein